IGKRSAVLTATGLAILLAFAPEAASAAKLHKLHSFCEALECRDGHMPRAGLVMDSAGNLYGTTNQGGRRHSGVAFELTAKDGHWRYKVLHHFCSTRHCADGGQPFADLIIDKDGSLYGTTSAGGTHDRGTVFKLSLDAGENTWTLSTLYD